MRKVSRVGYVVEGATDFIVLDEIVTRLLGHEDYIPTAIQPLVGNVGGDNGPLGGGWRGVLRWCDQIGKDGGLASSLVVSNYDVIVIHIDAEVAVENDFINWNTHCPPASERSNKLREHLTGLFDSAPPTKVVFCVPSQSLETWIFASLYSDEVMKYADFECRKDPEALLVSKPTRLVSGNPPKKITARYSGQVSRIADGWPKVISICGEAQRFENEFMSACS